MINQETMVKSPGGMEANFLTINGRGLKLYRYKTKDQVKFIRNVQQKAFELEMGPEAFETTSVEIDGQMFYGYYTEIVEIMPIINVAQANNRQKIICQHFNEEQYEEYKVLTQNLIDHDFPKRVYEDLFEANIGFKEFNGVRKMICIDFGC